MRRQLTTTRRRWVLGTLVVAILALGVGASQGLASASGKGTQQAPVQLHNDNCGVANGGPQIGHARFTLSSSGKMTISFQVNGADPGKYRLELWTGDGSCEQVADVSKFRVDSSGSGSKVSQTTCAGNGPQGRAQRVLSAVGACTPGLYFATIEKLDSTGTLTQEWSDSLIVELNL